MISSSKIMTKPRKLGSGRFKFGAQALKGRGFFVASLYPSRQTPE
jgi:hypothetical protein